MNPICSSSPSRRLSGSGWIGLWALFTVWFGYSHWLGLREPLERDITNYAVVAHEMSRGKLLYTDIAENKTPVLYLLYDLAERLFDYGPQAILALSLGVTLLTGAGLGFLIRDWGGGFQEVSAGLAFWILLSADLGLQANQPNAESFVNAFMVWGVWALGRASKTQSVKSCLGAGLAFGSATLVKLVAILPAFLIVLSHAWRGAESGRKRNTLAWVALAALGLWGCVGSYFALGGRWDDLVECTVKFNLRYFRPGSVLPSVRLNPLRYFPDATTSLWPAWLLAFLWTWGTDHPRRLEWWAWILGSFLSISITGRYYPHYFQLLIPPLCLASCWGWGAAVQWSGPAAGLRRSVSWAVLAVTVSLVVPPYRLDPTQWSLLKYGGDPTFIETREAAGRIKALLRPGETFFNWGDESGLYFYSGQDPVVSLWGATGLDVTDPRRQARVLGELKAHPPDLLVVSNGYLKEIRSEGPVAVWLRGHYSHRPLVAAGVAFTYLPLLGSRLERERPSLEREGGV